MELELLEVDKPKSQQKNVTEVKENAMFGELILLFRLSELL